MKRTIVLCFGFGCVMAAIQAGALLAAGIIVGVWLISAFGRRVAKADGYATVRGHTHDGPIARVALHEGGHAAAAIRVKGRVLGARVTGNDRSASGYTECLIPNDPASKVGVYLAGFAAAPGTTSPTDQGMVDRVLAGVPSPYRGMILREGQRIAAKAGASSDARRYAEILIRRGRL